MVQPDHMAKLVIEAGDNLLRLLLGVDPDSASVARVLVAARAMGCREVDTDGWMIGEGEVLPPYALIPAACSLLYLLHLESV